MCPECRTEHIVPDQGVQNIMDNEAMARFITKLQKPFDYGQQNLQSHFVFEADGQNLAEGM